MGGFLSVRSSIVIYQFGELLSTFELPGAWRKAIAERCRAEAAGKDEPIEHVFQRRKELGEEQKRPVEAIAEERRDMVWALLELGGLIYDLEQRCIVGLLPRGSMLPVLSLRLEKTGHWGQRERGLWLRSDYFSPKQVREEPHLPPPQPPSLTSEEQAEALALVRAGASLRQIARPFETSHGAIWLAKKAGWE